MKFTKDNLLNDGMYAHYCPNGWSTPHSERKFVARFKRMKRNLGPFCTFLRRNFTVEEYFARLNAGENPSDILKSKGYIASHIKSWMRRDGFPTTPEGYKAWIAKDRKAWEASTP